MMEKSRNPYLILKCCILTAAFLVVAPYWSVCESFADTNLALKSSRKSEYAEVQAAGYIEGRAAEVWAVLTDYEHLAEYMPTVKECRIENRSGNKVRLYYDIGFWFFTTSYTVETNEVVKNRYLTWRLLKGAFRINSGSWRLEPAGENVTRLAYHVQISHKIFPDAFILRALKSSLPDVYEAIQERVFENRSK